MCKLSLLLSGVLTVQVIAAAPQAATGRPSSSRSTAAQRGSSQSVPAKSSANASTVSADNMTDEQKTIYALGLSIYQSLSPLGLSPGELNLVKQALTEAAAGKPAVELSTWGPRIQAFAQARQKAASQAYLDSAAAEPGAVKTPSGLIYRELRPGAGASPKATDTVKVNYRGTLTNGTEFDSSYSRNEPAQFPLTGVVPCWTEGLQLMKVGGKGKLVCPSSLAYGDQGRPGIPGGAALTFEIELLDVVGTPQ